jgi:hypothetical protein
MSVVSNSYQAKCAWPTHSLLRSPTRHRVVSHYSRRNRRGINLKTNTHVIHQAEPKLNVQQCVCEVANHCVISYRSGRVSRAGIESNLSDTEDATMPREKEASKRKRVTKAAVRALGAATLTFGLAGGASASTTPTANAPQKFNFTPTQTITLSEEEIADVSLATFHLFDKENARGGFVQEARGCGCGGCRGCGCRGCGCRGCRGCGCRGCGGFGFGFGGCCGC